MMPPKMVPRALVSLGIMITRMAGWAPAYRSPAPSLITVPPVRQGLHAILASPSVEVRGGRSRMDPTSPQPSLASGTVTDVTLLRQVADRRPEALSELYDRYAPTL